MRLTCPNCGAQYEVPDEVIPKTGRDVQCSNCGDTWFQPPKDGVESGKGQPAASGGDAAPLPTNTSRPAAKTPAPPRNEVEDASADVPADRAPDTPERSDLTEPPKEPEQPPRPERREIDPSVASVLREEAERETRARSAAQGGIETQPDLGIEGDEGAARRARVARQRMALLRNLDAGPATRPEDAATDDTAPDIGPRSRGRLFPDIAELSSSLGPESAPHPGATTESDPHSEPGKRPRSAFRRGFLVAILIAALALLIYVFAVQLGDIAPALSDVLADYVSWVDGLRLWLDGQVAAMMLWLDAVTGSGAAAGDGG